MNGRILTLIAGLLVGGCSPSYGGLKMTVLQGSSTAEVRSSGIDLVHGRVVVFEVQARSSASKDYEVSDIVSLASTDDGVARVEPGVKVDTWMMFGVEPGSADLEVSINGSTEDLIPVTIVAATETAPEGG